MISKRTIRDINVHEKRVLLSVDFDVPIRNGKVIDDSRIKATLPTIRYLLSQGAAIILCSHLGRPNGIVDMGLSLRPLSTILKKHLSLPVLFSEDCIGSTALLNASNLKPGDILLLENTRFHPEEERNEIGMAKQLAAMADIFVNDGFGNSHRIEASNVGVAKLLPSVAGYLLEKEVSFISNVIDDLKNPLVVLLGGTKTREKTSALDSLLSIAGHVLLGGGMATTFQSSIGLSLGQSFIEATIIDKAKQLMKVGGNKIILPTDVVITESNKPGQARRTVPILRVPNKWKIADVGPKTIENYFRVLDKAATVLWSGPVGIYEMAGFGQGTLILAKKITATSAVTIVGGGDTVAAIKPSKTLMNFSHVSTGGGAMLKLFTDGSMPSLDMIENKL